MTKKSIVLLKNDDSILPLKKEGRKVALIGGLAADKNSVLGSWRIASDDHTGVSVLEGMKRYTGNTLVYEKGADVTLGEPRFIEELKINTTDKSGFKAAVATAKTADVVVMVLGEHGFQSGEARSRVDLGLPGVQQELLEAVYSLNTNIVLVLTNGRPLTIPWAAKHIPAIVETWQLGSQAGHAVAEVLYGDYNPSGKLSTTFPKDVGQIPIYYNHKRTGRPVNVAKNVFWSHYSDVDTLPLYPFGYGLSYTSFHYENLWINKDEYTLGEPIHISIDVTNTGKVKGKEVVQLYIHDVFSSLIRPVKELKGFQLIAFESQETKTVRFTLEQDDLGFYDAEGNYSVELGDFKVYIGGDSTTNLHATFTLV